MVIIQLNDRQMKIIEIVKEHEPITSEQIASMLNVTRATLRPDLAILTMTGILDARPKVGYFYAGIDENNIISKKLKSKKVSEIMSIPVLLTEETTVYNAIVTMFLEDVGSIYITNNGYLSGVVSRKDLLKSTIGGIDINKIPVGMIMTRMPNIVLANPNDSISEAVKKIIDHEVDSIPVVEIELKNEKEYYKVIGRISKTNIARLFVELCGE
ncbi:helix-turn-helix transcriptional regulator [Tepidibacter thalassicus]|uniref:CBS domain-containing protein n=1 Tax=Tepidibacter thalassicus DSM 15285 TaxID=1123350 RepID=A0A1M5NP95_9FIRM|nr:helix-turn-helix transcriptional regulator [Tepidibacter thalassicus]SHG91404.1 CBS domain-containing protein [Tepidibacter thalassicus DSM 15285]